MKLYHLHVFCHRQKVTKQNMQNKVEKETNERKQQKKN